VAARPELTPCGTPHPRPTDRISPSGAITMTSTRLTTSPWFRAFLALPDEDAHFVRLQHVLEQLPAAAFLIAPRTGDVLAINGKATMLTEWTRDELKAGSLAKVVGAPPDANALEPFIELEAGSVRSLSAVPLRTRSGRALLVDLRLSAFTEKEHGDPLVLALASPVEERLSHERDSAQQTRVLTAADQMFSLFAMPDESSLDLAVDLTDATQIFTSPELDNIYLLDPKNKRVVILTKPDSYGTSKYFGQVVFEKLDGVQDFYVEKGEKKLYLMTGQEIYRTDI